MAKDRTQAEPSRLHPVLPGPRTVLGVFSVLLLSLVLAGCGGPVSPTSSGPSSSINWDVPLDVATTPAEANERPGTIHVAWTADAFAVANERESDLDHRTVVQHQRVYTTNGGRGWYNDSAQDIGQGKLSARLGLWDLRALLDQPRVTIQESANATDATARDMTATGTYAPGKLDLGFTLHLTARDGHIVWARLESPYAREAPFTFTPLRGEFDFPVAPPAASMARAAADALSARAAATAGRVRDLVRNYTLHHGGNVPDHVDPDTLQLELALCRCPWPTNPFDGQAVRVADVSGGLAWTTCAPAAGVLVGYGYDGGVMSEPYGGGCRG